MFQKMCNFFTDSFCDSCGPMPLVDPNDRVEATSVIASTDVLEYLMRKKEMMLINRFGPLLRRGVQTYHDLLNESNFPSDNYLGQLATYITNLLPASWKSAVSTGINVNSDVTYEFEFPAKGSCLVPHSFITVKNLRLNLLDKQANPLYPYMDTNKFGLTDPQLISHNPFTLIRNTICPPRDKFFKYRILQGDIFCAERMFKFKMSPSPFCTYCHNTQVIESIKHLLWDCPRAKSVWEYINEIAVNGYNRDYVTYNSIILGSESPIPILENLIIIALKLLLSKDRTSAVNNNEIKNRIKRLFIIEKYAFRRKKRNFEKRWEKVPRVLLDGT